MNKPVLCAVGSLSLVLILGDCAAADTRTRPFTWAYTTGAPILSSVKIQDVTGGSALAVS